MENRTWIIVIVVVVALALLCLCVVACAAAGLVAYGRLSSTEWAQAQETVARELIVEPPAAVWVENPTGDVTIRTGPQLDLVVVEATKTGRSLLPSGAEDVLERIEVRVEHEGSDVRIEAALPEESGTAFGRVDLVITVPERADLQVVNRAGHIRITGIEGDIRVRSETGALRMNAVTVMNDVDVMNTTGDISFQGRLPAPGRGEPWEVLLRTETGDIEFLVPPDSRFTLDAESETGSVASKFALQSAQSGPEGGEPGRWLKGGVNQEPGGGNVVLRTETGNVVVGPLE